MSLLQTMPYTEYKDILSLNLEICEIIAKLANLSLSFTDTKNPGELLVKTLDRNGCSLKRFRKYVSIALGTKIITTYYKPQTKVAILIANEKYSHLSKLGTPSVDCDLLSKQLKEMSYIVVQLKNTTSSQLREVLRKLFEPIPEDSYFFIFYAGHGCEIGNVKCMLGIDCPTEDIQFEHCVTENYVLNEIFKYKPHLTLLIMDMCRVSLNSHRMSTAEPSPPLMISTATESGSRLHPESIHRDENPKIYSEISVIEEYQIHGNLIIAYSAQKSQSAYEIMQIECSTSINSQVTYELETTDMSKIVPGSSRYVEALCSRFTENLDINTLLDKVHGDVENFCTKQRPIKLQCGVSQRSLYDQPKGNVNELLDKLQKVEKENKDICFIYG